MLKRLGRLLAVWFVNVCEDDREERRAQAERDVLAQRQERMARLVKKRGELDEVIEALRRRCAELSARQSQETDAGEVRRVGAALADCTAALTAKEQQWEDLVQATEEYEASWDDMRRKMNELARLRSQWSNRQHFAPSLPNVEYLSRPKKATAGKTFEVVMLLVAVVIAGLLLLWK